MQKTPHQIVAEQTRSERMLQTETIINEQMRKLQGYKIEPRIERNNQNFPSIVGKCDNEPFIIFVQWMISDNHQYVGIVNTRYRGEEHSMVPPLDVLKPGKLKKKGKRGNTDDTV